jgi:hypothetical protein
VVYCPAAHLHVSVVVSQCRQPILVSVSEVPQQQVDVGAVGAKDGIECRIRTLHLQSLVILLYRLPQVELLLILQPRLQSIVAQVLRARHREQWGVQSRPAVHPPRRGHRSYGSWLTRIKGTAGPVTMC